MADLSESPFFLQNGQHHLREYKVPNSDCWVSSTHLAILSPALDQQKWLDVADTERQKQEPPVQSPSVLTAAKVTFPPPPSPITIEDQCSPVSSWRG